MPAGQRVQPRPEDHVEVAPAAGAEDHVVAEPEKARVQLRRRRRGRRRVERRPSDRPRRRPRAAQRRAGAPDGHDRRADQANDRGAPRRARAARYSGDGRERQEAREEAAPARRRRRPLRARRHRARLSSIAILISSSASSARSRSARPQGMMAEPGQLEQGRQRRHGRAGHGQAPERLAHELHGRGPGLARDAGTRGHALEPRVAADDGAARVGLGAQVLQTLLHRRFERRRGRGVVIVVPSARRSPSETHRARPSAPRPATRARTAKVQATSGGALSAAARASADPRRPRARPRAGSRRGGSPTRDRVGQGDEVQERPDLPSARTHAGTRRGLGGALGRVLVRLAAGTRPRRTRSVRKTSAASAKSVTMAAVTGCGRRMTPRGDVEAGAPDGPSG